MHYQLIEEYFDTLLFQQVVQSYFDTILAQLLKDHALTETKGKFVTPDGVVRRDDYDMSYPIHILNGLIPALRIYETYLIQHEQIENAKSEIWLKVLMIGFTLHDANKLVRVADQPGKSDLELALEQLRADISGLEVHHFFSDFEVYQNEIYYLALGTENRTRILANDYPATKFTREVLTPLCHLADGLASIQEVESPAKIYKVISRKLAENENLFGAIPISYIEVCPNIYVLSSQKLLQDARMILHQQGKKVLFSLRSGFVFFGTDASEIEQRKIKEAFLNNSDLDPLSSTTVDFQKCEFGFLGSLPFTKEVLEQIAVEKQDSFLALAPNSRDKIAQFDDFLVFLQKLLAAYTPIDEYIDLVLDQKTNNRFSLRFASRQEPGEDENWFRKFFILHKIQWLNTKSNKTWNADFEQWMLKADPNRAKKQLLGELKNTLPLSFEFNELLYTDLKDVYRFIQTHTNQPNYLIKNILCLAKTWEMLFTQEILPEDYYDQLAGNILDAFQINKTSTISDNGFFDHFVYFKGGASAAFNDYEPVIHSKAEMCLFSGTKAEREYTESVAFGVKARGFSNRTVTNLRNTSSNISAWIKEENNLRISKYPGQPEANVCLYTDFFETSLDISRDIITACVKAKNTELSFVEGHYIQFDTNARFQYNLFNLEFISLSPKIKDTFWQMRKWMLMIQKLGFRIYVTGIMSPYVPHKAVFHYENAPSWLKALGWQQIRLKEVSAVLEEMKLILAFGKDRIDHTILQIGTNRRAYFRLYYLLKADDQKKVQSLLTSFISNHPQYFQTDMTTIEQLVELALVIEVAEFRSSGASETWLIRTATDLLRQYAKQSRPREEIIAKISGEIYRKMRREYIVDKLNAIEKFATGVYDLLFVGAWQKRLPTANVQKDWIYEFAFVYKKKSIEYWDQRKREKQDDDSTSVEQL